MAYRFDFRDRSIAFSGNTAPIESVAKLAKGADILVHEALYLPALEAYIRDRIAKGSPIHFDDYMAHMRIDHSPVEDVGCIAQEAGVRTLVLSHLTPGIDGIPEFNCVYCAGPAGELCTLIALCWRDDHD